MFAVDHVILISAVLAILGVLASKLSPRFGVPVLVLFLGVGMLAGEFVTLLCFAFDLY